MIKQDGHLRTQGKYRKHELQARQVFSQVFLNVQSVSSQCNTWLRLLHLVSDIEVMCDETWVFDQSEHVQGPTDCIYIIGCTK